MAIPHWAPWNDCQQTCLRFLTDGPFAVSQRRLVGYLLRRGYAKSTVRRCVARLARTGWITLLHEHVLTEIPSRRQPQVVLSPDQLANFDVRRARTIRRHACRLRGTTHQIVAASKQTANLFGCQPYQTRTLEERQQRFVFSHILLASDQRQPMTDWQWVVPFGENQLGESHIDGLQVESDSHSRLLGALSVQSIRSLERLVQTAVTKQLFLELW